MAVRGHRGTENSVHRVPDVVFREDDCRIRKGYASENFSVIRRTAPNLLCQEKSIKKGIAVKRQRAGWDNEYLLKVLRAIQKVSCDCPGRSAKKT